jgi:hypothetical protein
MADRPNRYIGEPIEAGFDREPEFEKKPGCPSRFTWRGESHEIAALLKEWHDYRRRDRMAHNMRPAHAEAAALRGSWGVGRDFFRVRTAAGRVFDLYFDRSPKGTSNRKGLWRLYTEVFDEKGEPTR